jgi:hypothetical protein
MYSPKIREDLIPLIYQVAKSAGLHMTTWVNGILARALSDSQTPKEQKKEPKGKEVEGDNTI